MKKLLLAMTALATLATGITATPAAAQRWHDNGNRGGDRHGDGNWQSVNQRQANLYGRIEQGVRNGSITRGEAQRLRGRFEQLNRLEYRYRRDGLSQWERRDLDQRFDSLSRDIKWQRHDGQNRPWR